MSGLIRISGGTSTGGGGSANTAPVIRNFKAEHIGNTTITIRYVAEDTENAILRHYIYVNGQKKEITKEVKQNEELKEFEYTITGLTKETLYKIQVEVSDSLDTVRSDIINISTKAYVIYGIRVDENNSNPDTWIEYIDDAIGVETATNTSLGGWANKFPFNKIRIVGLLNGQVTKEINMNDKTKYIDETPVLKDVDVMVEIPKIYWDFKEIANGYELRISDHKFTKTACCLAHTVNDKEKDHIYIGVYEASMVKSETDIKPCLRSVNDEIISIRNNSKSYINSLKQNNKKGYYILNWYSVILLQILFLILFRNSNSKKVLGQGLYRKYNCKTGSANLKGIMYGDPNNKEEPISFLGIENIYGNFDTIICGLYTNILKTGDRNFSLLISEQNNENSLNTDLIEKKEVYSGLIKSGYITKIYKKNNLGFYGDLKELNGSSNLFYCNDQNINNYRDEIRSYSFGGQSNYGGFFNINNADISDESTSSRLVYLGE